jgi:hypothetical protein
MWFVEILLMKRILCIGATLAYKLISIYFKFSSLMYGKLFKLGILQIKTEVVINTTLIEKRTLSFKICKNRIHDEYKK